MTKFREIIGTGSYQHHASQTSEVAVLISLIVCLFVGILSDIHLGLNWLWVIPVIMFGISLLVAAPLYIIEMYIVSIMVDHMIDAPQPTPKDKIGYSLKLLRSLWVFASIITYGLVTYLFLNYIGI